MTDSIHLATAKRAVSCLLLAFGAFACAHPAPSAVTGAGAVGGSGSGGGTTTPPVFSLSDLDGAWYGKLVPTSLARQERNFYVKIAAGAATEAADSLGNQWFAADSSSSLDFSSSGVLNLDFSNLVQTNEIILSAQMDDAMTVLTGEFSYLAPDESLTEGSFTLIRSAGAGEFTASSLEGAWTGYGTNPRGKRRSLAWTLDASGALLDGHVFHPLTLADIHLYSPGAGTLSFSDDSVGRLDDIILLGDDGSSVTFDYLLVAQDGSLMGGPGFDTLLGPGVVTLGPTDGGLAAE